MFVTVNHTAVSSVLWSKLYIQPENGWLLP